MIPKRLVASAARRNAIKRRWREAFRLSAASLDAQFAACDLVVRMTARPGAPRQVFGKEAAMMDQLTARLIAITSAKREAAGWTPQ